MDINFFFCFYSSIDAVPCKDCDLSKKKERLAARMAIDKDDDIILGGQ